VRVRGLTKVYGAGEAAVHALRGVDLDVGRGELTAIMGPSGSGKSTLLHVMAALDRPSAGEVDLEGIGLARATGRQLTALRRDRLGFVFQEFNLVPTLTAWENITLPLEIGHKAYDMVWLDHLVDTLGLRERLKHRPAQLSGGQSQRVACARALAARPAVVFADEPTGNLDSAAAHDVLAFLRRAVDELGQTVVMVTHDPGAAGWADRVVFLADGRIVGERTNPTREDVLAFLGGAGAEESRAGGLAAGVSAAQDSRSVAGVESTGAASKGPAAARLGSGTRTV
jgi:putative ABC transport system ATP-binding protein